MWSPMGTILVGVVTRHISADANAGEPGGGRGGHETGGLIDMVML